MSNDQTLKPGEIVSLDPSNALSVKRTDAAYDSKIVGVVSPWGTRMNDPDGMRHEDSDYKNIGLLGKVPLLVTNRNGPIEISDKITSSSLQGAGMRSTESGMIVGWAMEEFNPNPESCQLIDSIEDAVWPEDKQFEDVDYPCYKLPSGELVSKIMVFARPQYNHEGDDISALQGQIDALLERIGALELAISQE